MSKNPPTRQKNIEQKTDDYFDEMMLKLFGSQEGFEKAKTAADQKAKSKQRTEQQAAINAPVEMTDLDAGVGTIALGAVVIILAYLFSKVKVKRFTDYDQDYSRNAWLNELERRKEGQRQFSHNQN